ncbi:hypothetical protein PN836_004050 [Ningiella sp. W23]|uniref:hypothetical protein n=1 Tax=Ningiella sp. W23 TaxID=3023715 RepID=UPI0037579980
MRRAVCALMLIFTSGCANIPIATMLKFSGFDENDFAQLDASQIRTKLEVSTPYMLNLEDTRLALSTDSIEGLRKYDFPLELLSEEARMSEAGFFSSERSYTEYTFKISDEGIDNFRVIQDTLKKKVETEYSFSVSAAIHEPPDKGKALILSIHLELNDSEEFVTLIDEYNLEYLADDE